jgi:penicillin-binding protein 2
MNYLERHNVKLVMAVMGVLFFIVIARLWQLQILNGKDFRRQAEENRLRIVDILAPRGIIYDRHGTPLVRNSPDFCVSILPDMAKEAQVDKIAMLLQVPPEEIIKLISAQKGSLEPVKLKDRLTFDELARIEARLSDFPELTIDVEIARDYIYKDMAAHLIGYIGKLTPAEAQDPAFDDVPRSGYTGQWGLEKYYDKELRGVAGQRLIEVDALGRELRIVGEIPPKKGKDITLALDLKLQLAAEQEFGDRAGAMVALNPRTGELLGLLSKPSFDPNIFVPSIKPHDWSSLVLDERHPMLDRAFQSQYPPGSTFKIVTAISALEDGVVTPDETVSCRGGFALGNHVFGCWRHEGHGPLNIYRGIVESCDVFFYTVGLRTGMDRIAYYARALGLDSKVGIGLGSEKKGLIPNSEWKMRTRNQKLYPGETVVASIGQGYVAVTPLQMARLMGIVGTGAKFIPNISFLKYKGGQVPGQPVPIPLKDSTVKLVQDALAGVVTEDRGTAHLSAFSKVVPISGKTGTAQVVSSLSGPDHAWFVAYAPSSEPEVALAVIVEKGGHGASAAAPIARKAIEAYVQGKQEQPVKYADRQTVGPKL